MDLNIRIAFWGGHSNTNNEKLIPLQLRFYEYQVNPFTGPVATAESPMCYGGLFYLTNVSAYCSAKTSSFCTVKKHGQACYSLKQSNINLKNPQII